MPVMEYGSRNPPPRGPVFRIPDDVLQRLREEVARAADRPVPRAARPNELHQDVPAYDRHDDARLYGRASAHDWGTPMDGHDPLADLLNAQRLMGEAQQRARTRQQYLRDLQDRINTTHQRAASALLQPVQPDAAGVYRITTMED